MKRPVLKVIEGGRKDGDGKTLCEAFDIAVFMESETIDTSNLPPVDPEPLSEMEIYLLSQLQKDDPDFTP